MGTINYILFHAAFEIRFRFQPALEVVALIGLETRHELILELFTFSCSLLGDWISAVIF